MLNYAWLIFVPPLIALLINIFLGRRLGRTISGWLGALAVGLSFVVAVGLYLSLYGLPVEERSVTAGNPRIVDSSAMVPESDSTHRAPNCSRL